MPNTQPNTSLSSSESEVLKSQGVDLVFQPGTKAILVVDNSGVVFYHKGLSSLSRSFTWAEAWAFHSLMSTIDQKESDQ